MRIWNEYHTIFKKYGIEKFEHNLISLDAVDTPFINSNKISSVYMEFLEPNETRVSWMYKESCLSLFIIDTEIQLLIDEFSNCDIIIFIEGETFLSINEESIEYILSNKITSLRLVTNMYIRDYLSSHVRYIQKTNCEDDYDAIYAECTRDIRK